MMSFHFPSIRSLQRVLHTLPCIANYATVLVLLLIGVPHMVVAGPPLAYYLPAETKYDPSITVPEAFFGFQVGEWHLPHERLTAYMYELARESDRVTLMEYARTYENRPLLVLTITTSDNHHQLETIRERHLILSDPQRSTELSLANMPAVVYMGYSVHGNEASGSNAAALIAYHLAAALDSSLEKILSETIVLLDPSLNPDGLSRFAQWANMHRGRQLVADPAHREHSEVWPRGRTNHYWFDLNRDWLLAQHPESQGRLEVFHHWRPNVLTDHHEMGKDRTFFFQPGVPSRNNPLTPLRTVELTESIAIHHANALDRLGSLYFTKERYDDFYMGKGSTYPDLNGAVGILFEQASVRGHLQENAHGERTFPFAIRNQVVTSLSTLDAVNQLRLELLTHQRNFYTTAITDAKDLPVKGYIFGDGGDRARWFAFVQMLQTHRIQVHELRRPISVNDVPFVPGSAWIVPLSQPQQRLLRSIFERRTSFQDSVFYDVSAWTLPLAFDLPHAELRGRAWNENLLGDTLVAVEFPKTHVDTTGPDPYAYAFSWSDYYAPRVLYQVLAADVKAYVATSPFQATTSDGDKDFNYGTIVVPTRAQADMADTIRHLMADAAEMAGVQVYSLTSGLTRGGINLGSPRLVPVVKPEVAIVVGDVVRPQDAGEAWHLLDRRYHMPVSLVDHKYLDDADLDRYTTIVLTHGRYGKSIAPIYPWVRDGGTLVAVGGGARRVIEDSLVHVELLKAERDTTIQRRAYANLDQDRGAQEIGGAIFATELDRTHPLGFGYVNERLPILRRGDTFLKIPKNPYSTPLRYAEEPLMSGYISKRNAEILEGSAGIIVATVGKGRVVLIADQLNFRAYWYGTSRLFANAVFFAPIVDAEAGKIERPDKAP